MNVWRQGACVRCEFVFIKLVPQITLFIIISSQPIDFYITDVIFVSNVWPFLPQIEVNRMFGLSPVLNSAYPYTLGCVCVCVYPKLNASGADKHSFNFVNVWFQHSVHTMWTSVACAQPVHRHTFIVFIEYATLSESKPPRWKCWWNFPLKLNGRCVQHSKLQCICGTYVRWLHEHSSVGALLLFDDGGFLFVAVRMSRFSLSLFVFTLSPGPFPRLFGKCPGSPRYRRADFFLLSSVRLFITCVL